MKVSLSSQKTAPLMMIPFHLPCVRSFVGCGPAPFRFGGVSVFFFVALRLAFVCVLSRSLGVSWAFAVLVAASVCTCREKGCHVHLS